MYTYFVNSLNDQTNIVDITWFIFYLLKNLSYVLDILILTVTRNFKTDVTGCLIPSS